LQGLCAEILVRANRGSDFGAYKDAVLELTRTNKQVSRLLLLNDSAYVFRGLKEARCRAPFGRLPGGERL
jgi:hypothetical protein